MSNNTITIPIGLKEPGDYLTDLHQAITEFYLLIFERRSLDLDEKQCYALHVMADLQARIVSEGGRTC